MSQNNKSKDPGRPLIVTGEGLTKQSFKDEVDINKIVDKFNRTGLVTHVKNNPGAFLDVSNVQDFHKALNTVNESKRLFMALPAKIRTKFKNNPANMIEFISDKANLEEAEKLGMVEPGTFLKHNPPKKETSKSKKDTSKPKDPEKS